MAEETLRRDLKGENEVKCVDVRPQLILNFSTAMNKACRCCFEYTAGQWQSWYCKWTGGLCGWMGQKDFGYEIRLLLSTIIMREMNITNTHKKISFNSRFEQGKSYTGYTWTTLDSGLKDGIASWPQASLGLAAKHVSVIDISGGRSMPYSTTFMAHFLRSGHH